MTAFRLWPSKMYGGVPTVDKFITRGVHNDPNGRWIYNGTKFKNLTLCREYVARMQKINTPIPSASVTYEPVCKKNMKPTARTRSTSVVVAPKVQVEVTYTDKGYRVMIPTPMADVNVNMKTLDDVLSLVNKMFKDKK